MHYRMMVLAAAVCLLTGCGSRENKNNSSKPDTDSSHAELVREYSQVPDELKYAEFDRGKVKPLKYLGADGTERADSCLIDDDLLKLDYTGLEYDYDENVRNTHYSLGFKVENKSDELMNLTYVYGVNDAVMGEETIYLTGGESYDASAVMRYLREISPVTRYIDELFIGVYVKCGEKYLVYDRLRIVLSEEEEGQRFDYDDFETLFEDDKLVIKQVEIYDEYDERHTTLYIQNKSSDMIGFDMDTAADDNGELRAAGDIILPKGTRALADTYVTNDSDDSGVEYASPEAKARYCVFSSKGAPLITDIDKEIQLW